MDSSSQKLAKMRTAFGKQKQHSAQFNNFAGGLKSSISAKLKEKMKFKAMGFDSDPETVSEHS